MGELTECKLYFNKAVKQEDTENERTAREMAPKMYYFLPTS